MPLKTSGIITVRWTALLNCEAECYWHLVKQIGEMPPFQTICGYTGAGTAVLIAPEPDLKVGRPCARCMQLFRQKGSRFRKAEDGSDVLTGNLPGDVEST